MEEHNKKEHIREKGYIGGKENIKEHEEHLVNPLPFEKEEKTATKPIVEHTAKKQEKLFTKPIWGLLAVAVVLVLFNQYQLSGITGMVTSGFGSGSGAISLSGKDISNLDLASLKSTGHTLAAVFPVENIQTSGDAIAILFPTGTPDYGAELGVSYDDPVGSLDVLNNMYRSLKAEVQQNNPDGFQKFMNLASKPVGISCEYCCGLKTIGIDKNGDSTCGCKHNPALLSIALYLSAYTDYNDGEILREVMRWKTLFFPKNMIELGMTVAGGDTSALDNLPGMVGGC